MLVTRADVEAAAARVTGWVRETPVVDADGVVFKLEQLQHTGSFKPRGMFNRLLSTEVPEVGIVIASGGNAGLAAAFAAARLGHRSTVFVPETAPEAKVTRLRGIATEVRLAGSTYAEALEASLAHEAATGAVALHAYDQIDVVAGQGTIALELERQAPDLDTLLVAVGGGGLIGGIAAAFGDRVRIVAVETEGCPTLHAALAAGEPVDIEVGGVAADSLGARRIGEVCWSVRSRIAGSLLVPDAAVAGAQARLWEVVRQVAEPGGATAYAALTSGVYEPNPGERVGVLVCGANAPARAG
ncbi:MAG TPA: threonine/serine dehydratase [Acidimicrobiales bacterium]|nr:threonine/serine dehydratase [Acidimicrobiales bacterium]